MPFLGPERRQHVGMDKYKIVSHDFNHFTLGPSSKGRAGAKMAFTLTEPEELHPSFNVLYVRTQKPTVFKMPLVRLLLDTWAETVELVKPVFRLGIPESSLKDKCPWWREDGSPLPNTPNLQTQRLLKAISNEAFGAGRMQQQQQQPSYSSVPRYLGQMKVGPAAGQTGVPSSQLHEGAQAATRGPQVPGAGAAEGAGAAAGGRHPGPGAHGHGHGAGAGHGHGHGHGGKHHLTPFQEKEEFVEAVTPWVVLGLNVAAWCYLGTSANKPTPGM